MEKSCSSRPLHQPEVEENNPLQPSLRIIPDIHIEQRGILLDPKVLH
jgi:hypothetical protein